MFCQLQLAVLLCDVTGSAKYTSKQRDRYGLASIIGWDFIYNII